MTGASCISKKTDWLNGAPVFVFVWLCFVFLVSDLSIYHGLLGFDTDVYLHATQLRTLIDNGNWFDPFFRQYDPPTTEQYSRLSDVIMLGVAAPLSQIFTTQTAVLLAFATIPVFVLLPCYLWLSVVAAKPFVGASWAKLAPVAAVYSSYTICFFIPGQGDHHNLQVLLMLAVMCFALRFFSAQPPAYPGRLGVVFALTCSVSAGLGVEGLPLLASFIGCFVFANLHRPSRAGWSFLAAIAVSLPICLALLLVATWPVATYATPVLYRLSGLHVLLSLGLTVFIAGTGGIAFVVKHVVLRFVLSLVLLGGLAFGVFTLVPHLVDGPWMGIDPVVRSIVASAPNLGPIYSPKNKASLFLLVPVFLACFGYARAFRSASVTGRWLVVLFFSLTLGIGFTSLFYMARLTIWVAPLCGPGLVLAIKILYQRVQQQPMGRRRVLSELVLQFLLGPLNGPALSSMASNAPRMEPLTFFLPTPEKNDDFLNVVTYFNGQSTTPRQARILVGPSRDAAALMFFTPHMLVGSAFQLSDIASAAPYFAFYKARTEKEAAKVLIDYQIDYVLFNEDTAYDLSRMTAHTKKNGRAETQITWTKTVARGDTTLTEMNMSARIRQDVPPSFIERVDLPFGRYRVYKTNYDDAAKAAASIPLPQYSEKAAP